MEHTIENGAQRIRVSLRATTLAIQVGEREVWSFRPDGVLIGAFVGDRSVVRRLDDTLVQRGARARVLSPAERTEVDATLRSRIAAIHGSGTWQEVPQELRSRLEDLAAHGLDRGATEVDLVGSQPTMPPILPPDQYKAVPVTISVGCAFNGCTFCDLYLGRQHHVLDDSGFAHHLELTRAIYAGSIRTRTSVFLGDANALGMPVDILLDRMERIRSVFPTLIDDAPGSRGRLAGFYSFMDLFTGKPKTMGELGALKEARLKRVYIGLETGNRDLQRWIRKPGSPERALTWVEDLKAAGLNVGIMLIPGLGGERFSDVHLSDTMALLQNMPLGAGDIVYLSPLSVREDTPYALRSLEDEVHPLTDAQLRDQMATFQSGLRSSHPAAKVTRYLVDRWVAT